MNMFSRVIAVGIAMLYMHAASAYEILTHGKLSEAAYDQSGLNKDTQLLQNLGLKTGDTFPNSENPRPRTIKELISDGSRFEDNLLLGSLLRVRHHFYDPVYNRPLTVLGVAAGEKSPDWALEDTSTIGSQDYSYRDARNYFYQALTATRENDRNKNFGLAFQTLGHIIHHVQDMAQPQHVRNDIHPNVSSHKSLYEEYTDANRNKLLYTGYNPVTFPKTRSFWTTGDGKGLAEFTNRNFVSAGTNYQLKNDQPAPNTRYSQPVPLAGESVHIKDLLKEEGQTTDLDRYVDFVASTAMLAAGLVSGEVTETRSSS